MKKLPFKTLFFFYLNTLTESASLKNVRKQQAPLISTWCFFFCPNLYFEGKIAIKSNEKDRIFSTIGLTWYGC